MACDVLKATGSSVAVAVRSEECEGRLKGRRFCFISLQCLRRNRNPFGVIFKVTGAGTIRQRKSENDKPEIKETATLARYNLVDIGARVRNFFLHS